MRPIRSGGARRTWEPPAITKLGIGTETKSSGEDGRRAGLETLNSDQSRSAQPQPPTVPATKLGFSFEWSFPLSARTE